MSRPCSCDCHGRPYECGPCGTLHGMVEGLRAVLAACRDDSQLGIERFPSVKDWQEGRVSAYNHALDIVNAWSMIGGDRPEPEPEARPVICGATMTQADPLFPDQSVTYTCGLDEHPTGNHQDSATEFPAVVIWGVETTGHIVPADPEPPDPPARDWEGEYQAATETALAVIDRDALFPAQ